MTKQENIQSRLDDYYALQIAAKDLVKKEREMRVELLNELFPSASLGTFHEDKGRWHAKGVFRNSAKIDVAALNNDIDMLTDEERACIKWKPELMLTPYKELTEEQTSGFFEDIITFKPDLPSLELTMNGDT